MRVLFLIVGFFLGSNMALGADLTLEGVLKDYAQLQKELEDKLSPQYTICNQEHSRGINNCSVKEICQHGAINFDSPFIYSNELGEKILNENYYLRRNAVNACLKEKYADEIAEKKEEVLSKLKTEHLKKLLTANKKLGELTTKHNQGNAVFKISNEILNQSINAGLNDESSTWEDPQSSREDLADVIKVAENKQKIKLNPEIKKTLIEIQFIKSNANYEKEADLYEASILPDQAPADPLFNFALLTSEAAAGGIKKLESNQKKFIQKSQDTYNVFIETKNEMVQYLLAKRNPKNESSIKRLVDRIKTIQFKPPRLTETLVSECSVPNAFYNRNDHGITLCPQILNYPKMAQVETIAHELAHSIDSCLLGGAMISKKGPLVIEDAPFEVELKMEPIAGQFAILLGEEVQSVNSKNIAQNKMKYKDHPFSDTLSCLSSPASAGAKFIDKKEVLKRNKEALKELSQYGKNNLFEGQAKYLNFVDDNFQEFFDYFQGCDLSQAEGSKLLHSQVQEAFADKMASEIVAKHIAKQNEKKAMLSVVEMTLFYGEVCSREGKDAFKLREFAKKHNCKQFFENKSMEQKILDGLNFVDPQIDSHVKAEKRIERILLAHPEIRKALKCAPNKELKYCE